MKPDQLKEIRIQGLRCLEDVSISLDGLTVLIGENGSGKSSIIEAFEVLHKAGTERKFLEPFGQIHGGLYALLRRGSDRIKFIVKIEGTEGDIEYDFSIIRENDYPVIGYESLRVGGNVVIDNNRGKITVFDANKIPVAPGTSSPERLLISAYGSFDSPPAIKRLLTILENIDVHLPFDVSPSWAHNERRTPQERNMRQPALVMKTSKLQRFGANLVNAYIQLRSKPEWDEIQEYVSLGLSNIEQILVKPGEDAGTMSMRVKMKGTGEMPISSLSDGQLAYLNFIALFFLDPEEKALVAFDEPDLHLHPYLLGRVLDMFNSLSEKVPVVIATHSDGLLDGLPDPAKSTLLCELDEKYSTRLIRPDPDALARWLKRYQGLGTIRSEGYESYVMDRKARE
jgi:predicted ATPase